MSSAGAREVLVLNGPNLGRLGTRQPEVYGTTTHDELAALCVGAGAELGLTVEVRQTDSEAELLGWLRGFVEGKRPGEPGYPRRVFLVHGDPEAQVALEPKVRALGLATHVPHWHERVELT